MDAQTVVIGGGITGVGIARDLALRGVDVTLLERGRLTGGPPVGPMASSTRALATGSM